MQVPENNEVAKKLGLILGSALEEGLKQACRSDWEVTTESEEDDTLVDDPAAIYFSLEFSGKVQGNAYLLVRAGELESFDFRSIEEDATPTELQLVSALETELSACSKAFEAAYLDKQPGTVKLRRCDRVELSGQQKAQLCVRNQSNQFRVTMLLGCSEQLASAVQVHELNAFAYPSVPEVSATNLDLVMDVELQVILRFGQRQLPLREVLRLASGSVVELDRQVDEPVELVLDGRVIARGEAVVVDGNYGMRIHEVC